MKRKITLIAIIVLVVAILVGGFLLLNRFVFNSPEKQLIGKWENEEGTGGYEFFEDGTVKVTVLKLSKSIFSSELSSSYDGKYTVKKDQLKLSYEGKLIASIEVKKNYRFEVKKDVLYLTDTDKNDQEPTKYTRVKEQ